MDSGALRTELLASIGSLFVYLTAQVWVLCAGVLLSRRVFEISTSATRLIFAVLFWGVANAMVVQAIGFSGQLHVAGYLASMALLGACGLAVGRRDKVPGAEPLTWRQLRRTVHGIPGLGPFRRRNVPFLLNVAPPLALGLGLLLFGSFPTDIDSLAIHGPMMVEWIHQGSLDFANNAFRYPTFWESVLTPALLLGRGEALVLWPRLLILLGYYACARELGRRCGLPGKTAVATAAISTTPTFLHLLGAFKADAAFAFGVLAAGIALERAARGARGSSWLLVLACCFVIGTKPSGFLYVILVAAAFSILCLRRLGLRAVLERPLRGFSFLGLAIMLLAASDLVQLRNLLQHGNPIFPYDLEVFGIAIGEGRGTSFGSTILDHVFSEPRLFPALARQLVLQVSPLFLLLALVLPIAPLAALARLRSSSGEPGPRLGRSIKTRSIRTWLACWLTTGLLFGLYFVTPFSAGREGDFRFVANGSSLRYALAAIALTHVVALGAIFHALASRFGRPRAEDSVSILLALSALVWGSLTLVRVVPLTIGLEVSSSLGLSALMLLLLACALLRRLVSARGDSPARPLRGGLSVVAVVIAASLFYDAAIARRHHEPWIEGCETLLGALEREPQPLRIAIFRRGVPYRYLLYGEGLRNRIVRYRPNRLQRVAPDHDALYLDIEVPELDALLDDDWDAVGRCGFKERQAVLIRRTSRHG